MLAAFPLAGGIEALIVKAFVAHLQNMGPESRTNEGRMKTAAILAPLLGFMDAHGAAAGVARTLGFASAGPIRTVAKRAR